MFKVICFFAMFSCNAELRDPFKVPVKEPSGCICKAICYLEGTDKRCALIVLKGKEYTVRVGDRVAGYEVVNILHEGVALKSIKGTELKIAFK